MTTERKLLPKEVDTLDLDGVLLKDAVKDLTELLEHYGDTARISEESRSYLIVVVPTLESDDQLANRLKSEALRVLNKEARDRAEFERLQKKFVVKP